MLNLFEYACIGVVSDRQLTASLPGSVSPWAVPIGILSRSMIIVGNENIAPFGRGITRLEDRNLSGETSGCATIAGEDDGDMFTARSIDRFQRSVVTNVTASS